MVICLERGADLHMAQLMPLPLTVSCFSKIQICFTFLVPAYPGSHGKRAVKRVCVCVILCTLQPDYEKIARYCNIWRNYNDIDDSWDSVKQIIEFYGDDKTSFSEVAAPGSFNDPDMVSCFYL